MSASPAAVSGRTRVAAVIGWPVRHSLSPAIHNAAFATTGLDWVYLALPVPPGSAATAIAGMAALGIEGLSVTMPHKAAVAASLDHLTDDAVALGAVNCVFRDGERIVGDNTDGGGFVDSLGDHGIDPSGMRCVVVGAGGAARAVVRSLAAAGATEVAVLARRAEPATAAAALAGTVGVIGVDAHLSSADLIVNATPIGMGADDASPFDPDRCRDGAVVADVVYHPAVTPLLRQADDRGLRTVGGIGMLVHQAARAFARWTGIDAPVDVMAAAAQAGLTATG